MAGSGATSPDRAPNAPSELTDAELEHLRTAGRSARSVARTAAVGFGLFFLLLLDVAIGNPGELRRVTKAQGPTIMASNVLFTLGGVGAVALLWVFARNVAAFHVRGDAALNRAFRFLRYFLVLWTCVTGVMALLNFVAVWRKF